MGQDKVMWKLNENINRRLNPLSWFLQAKIVIDSKLWSTSDFFKYIFRGI